MKILLITFTLLCLCSSLCFGTYSVKEMSLEEKVGQLLIVHFHGQTANEDAKKIVQDLKIGGIIYYNWSNGLVSPEQVQTLSSGLQKLTQENRFPIPLIIAVDQEGGAITRLQNGFTIFPDNRSLGMTANPNLAEENALISGKELLAVGVNMNLAPVVDINCNPRNPVIGPRSFGDHPEIVIAFGGKALQGYQRAGIISALKHFPGHGDVEVDSHLDLPIIHKSLSELEKMELLPFRHLALSSDAIVTAHLLVEALDSENCSTLSERTLRYLRETIGFDGVIISDSLVMEGVLKKFKTVDETAIAAINAGCDLLILGGKQLMGQNSKLELTISDIERIHQVICNAVKNGIISKERLNEANERILQLKKRYFPLFISSELAKKIGEKIWKNECGGTLEGLTHWNKGENFASLGIGHFIWYPADKKEGFQETFPSLLLFLEKEGSIIPDWLKSKQSCPWNSRDEFYQNIHSLEMQSLRQFLWDTKNLQAIFITNRLNEIFSQIVNALDECDKMRITSTFNRLANNSEGLYALIDYLNFKGAGTSPTETYQGQSWGLLQVLQKIPESSTNPLIDFVEQAKFVLSLRVENSPPERGEKKWLNGWHNRINSYLQ